MSTKEADLFSTEKVSIQSTGSSGTAEKNSKTPLRGRVSGLIESIKNYSIRLRRIATKGTLGAGVIALAGSGTVPASASKEDISHALNNRTPLSKDINEVDQSRLESVSESAPAFLRGMEVSRAEWLKNARDIKDIQVAVDANGNLTAIYVLDKSPSGAGVRLYRALTGNKFNSVSSDINFAASVAYMQGEKGFIGGEQEPTSAIPKLVDLNGNPIPLPEGMRGVVEDITAVEGAQDVLVNIPGFETSGSIVIIKPNGQVVRVTWPLPQDPNAQFTTNNQLALGQIRGNKTPFYSSVVDTSGNKGLSLGEIDLSTGQSTAQKKYEEAGTLDGISARKNSNNNIEGIYGISPSEGVLSYVDIVKNQVIKTNYENSLQDRLPDFENNSLTLSTIVSLTNNFVLAGGSYAAKNGGGMKSVLTVWEVTNEGKLRLVNQHKVEQEKESSIRETIRVKYNGETGILINVGLMGLAYMKTDAEGRPIDGTIVYLGNGLPGYEPPNPQNTRTVHRASLPHVTFQYSVPSRN